MSRDNAAMLQFNGADILCVYKFAEGTSFVLHV